MAKKYTQKSRSIGMTDPVYEQLRLIADSENDSISGIVGKAIDEYLSSRHILKAETETQLSDSAAAVQAAAGLRIGLGNPFPNPFHQTKTPAPITAAEKERIRRSEVIPLSALLPHQRTPAPDLGSRPNRGKKTA